jgi:hypothetical protein
VLRAIEEDILVVTKPLPNCSVCRKGSVLPGVCIIEWRVPVVSFLGVGVKMSRGCTSATIWPTVPAPDGKCGVVGGMRIVEVVGEHLLQCRFVHKSHMTWPGLEPRPSLWETVD